MAVAQATCTATWIVAVGGNDVTWRAEWPAAAVGGKVMAVRTDEVNEVFTQPNNASPFPWRILGKLDDGTTRILDTAAAWGQLDKSRLVSAWTDFPAHEGAAVWVRPDLARATLAKAMRMNGVRTIAETDDNYFSDARHNIFLRRGQTTDKIRLDHAKAMVSMDANVFSTRWLRDRYHKEYRRLFGDVGLPEMHVCRNHIPREMWPEQVPNYGPLRVGFMGSPSHLWDVHRAYASFHAAKQLKCETVMIGFNPADPDPDTPDEIELDGETLQLRSEKSKTVRDKWQAVVDKHVRWIDPAEYHRVPLPLDIGIAPLRRNDNTLGKSDIKAIEYTVSGAAVVAESHPVFRSAGWVHEVNCLLASSQTEMARQTVRLIRDDALRRELVQNAREMVATERNEDVMKEEWDVAIRG